MADRLPVVQQSGGINDIAQLLAQLGPLLGSGTTKTGQTNKSTVDPESNDQANNLIAQIMASVSPENLDVLQGNILENAKQKFGATAIQGNAAGVRAYSDTTRKLLQNDAMAKATAEAMQARLAATNAAQKTAATLVESKMQASKSVATQSQQRTGPNNAGKLLGLALPAAMIYNKIGGKKPEDITDQPEELGNPESTFVQNGNDSADSVLAPTLIGASESTIPEPQDLGSFATDAELAAADSVNLDSLEAGDSLGAGADSLEVLDQGDGLDEIFSGAGDLGWFADGGVVGKPGRRPAPTGSYTAETLEDKRTPILRQALARSEAPSLGPKANTSSSAKKPRTFDNQTGEELEGGNSDASSIGVTADAPAGTAPSAFGVGPIGLGLTAARGVLGATPVGMAVGLARMAAGKFAINKAVELFNELGFGQFADTVDPATVETLGPIAMSKLTEQMGLHDVDPTTVETLGPIAMSKLTDEMLGIRGPLGEDTPDEPDPSSAPATTEAVDAAMGDGTGSTAGAPGGPGEGNAADSGGVGGGSSDGSDTAKDGGVITAKNQREATGVDKKVIHITPGEVVIPLDTVDHFGEDFFEELIAMTHRKAA